ncbi:MAG: C4-type zinc ribbon domain-containing protein [Desulfobacterales bacterium]|nr:C4-type zinc ribbon domain-containing protein [Desulfobacterales bacterium]
MKEISKQEIETLVRLQEAETEIVRLQSVLESVEKQKVKIASRLKKFGRALSHEKDQLDQIKQDCASTEQEVKMLDDRIIKSNENLRMVKTNKEYQVLLREVDDNKKRKDALETGLLEMYDSRDALQAKVDETEKEYQQLESEILSEQAAIEKKSTDDRELLEDYQQRREDTGRDLDPGLMDFFNRVSKMNKGLAVAETRNGVCMGCFMNIPPQLSIEVQRAKELISCPQCSRILYHKE